GISGSFIALGCFFAVVVVIAGQLLAWPDKDYVPPAPPAASPRQTQITQVDWPAPAMLGTIQFYALVFLFFGSAQSGLLVIAIASKILSDTAGTIAFFAANRWILSW